MLKKSITYVDFTEETVTDDFYFHMSKADLVRLEASHPGGFAAWLERISKSNDGKAIIQELENLIMNSYGQKSDDGRRFIKNDQIREEFKSSEAYSTLLFELCTNAEAAAAFVNGIVPPGLDEELKRIAAVQEGHPSDPAAKMADPGNIASEITKDEPHLTSGRNVFENSRVGEDEVPAPQGPRVLTEREMREMDPEQLRLGLAKGRYTLS